jgi:hypothetical protein
VQTLVDGDKLRLTYGAQDLSQHDSGAYTGEISGAFLAKLGCTFAVVGHSERRSYHAEGDQLVADKAKAALSHGLVPIVCVGETLSELLDELEKNGNVKIEKGDNMYMKLGISKIPEIILDNTDRNRTSPFAFTGNKFEFRAVGSSANCGGPMTTLNVIVAEVLRDLYKDIEKEMQKKYMEEGTERK